MADVKVFVHPNNTATIICPACNLARQVSVKSYRNKKHSIKIRCICKSVFVVQLDFRRHYRKKTQLTGTYRIIKPPSGGGGIIHIRNLSQSGLGFTVSGVHKIKIGQSLLLEFELNDRHQTTLTKKAYVRYIDQNYIGCQFMNEDSIEKALGFYTCAAEFRTHSTSSISLPSGFLCPFNESLDLIGFSFEVKALKKFTAGI